MEKVASKHQLLLRILSKIRDGFLVNDEFNRFGVGQYVLPIVSEILTHCSPPPMCHVTHVMCHMSHVMFHMSYVRYGSCHISYLKKNIDHKF